MNRPVGIAAILLLTIAAAGCMPPQFGEDAVRARIARIHQEGPAPALVRQREEAIKAGIARNLGSNNLEISLNEEDVIEDGKTHRSTEFLLIVDVPDIGIDRDDVMAAVKQAIRDAGCHIQEIALLDHRQTRWSITGWLWPISPVVV
ncbi:MAG TPA: hypothetical protein VH370_00775 [Humisphaera sp.]|nr:hypothetical protein [Humisphaera sp.]